MILTSLTTITTLSPSVSFSAEHSEAFARTQRLNKDAERECEDQGEFGRDTGHLRMFWFYPLNAS